MWTGDDDVHEQMAMMMTFYDVVTHGVFFFLGKEGECEIESVRKNVYYDGDGEMVVGMAWGNENNVDDCGGD